jgi:hypothetical protein
MNPDALTAESFSTRTGKAQWVRALDVFVIGPLMVAGGMSLTQKSPFWGVMLGAMGVGTMTFNARNWLLVERAKRLNTGGTDA